MSSRATQLSSAALFFCTLADTIFDDAALWPRSTTRNGRIRPACARSTSASVVAERRKEVAMIDNKTGPKKAAVDTLMYAAADLPSKRK
jgi:hypothetical protein